MLVVGGGMAGVSAGAALAAEAQVVLVEAEAQLAYHTTGRSAATYVPTYGPPLVQALTVASRPLHDELSAEGGVALLRPRPVLSVAVDATGLEAIRASTTAAETGLQFLDPAEAVGLCPALRSERVLAATLDTAAMEIDVAGLHQAYLARLRRRGGRVVASAPVRSVARQHGAWRVEAGAETISAGLVVDAAGAWADEVAALAGVPGLGLTPKLRSAWVSPVRGEAAGLAGWPFVTDAVERWYFKPEPGGVLCSPGDETPSPPTDARPDQLEIARAIEAINWATTLGLRSVSHAWAGLRSFVADRGPVAGAWADQPGFFFLAGQGGYGIQMAPALAELAASLVAGTPLPPPVAAAGVDAGAVSPERLRRA